MICAPSLHSGPPCAHSAMGEDGAAGLGRKIGMLQTENCFCWERQREIIKKDEQRAPAKLSRFMGGGYAADGLLHKWYSAVQYFKIVHKMY